jgi:hypothetical protein
VLAAGAVIAAYAGFSEHAEISRLATLMPRNSMSTFCRRLNAILSALYRSKRTCVVSVYKDNHALLLPEILACTAAGRVFRGSTQPTYSFITYVKENLMDIQRLALLAGMISTSIFAVSHIPMLIRAFRTKDLRSYSAINLVLSNLGNGFHWLYVVSLPFGPIWFLHGFYSLAAALMLLWYVQHQSKWSASKPGSLRFQAMRWYINGISSTKSRTLRREHTD